MLPTTLLTLALAAASANAAAIPVQEITTRITSTDAIPTEATTTPTTPNPANAYPDKEDTTTTVADSDDSVEDINIADLKAFYDANAEEIERYSYPSSYSSTNSKRAIREMSVASGSEPSELDAEDNEEGFGEYGPEWHDDVDEDEGDDEGADSDEEDYEDYGDDDNEAEDYYGDENAAVDVHNAKAAPLQKRDTINLERRGFLDWFSEVFKSPVYKNTFLK